MVKYKYKTIKHGATVGEVCPFCEIKNGTRLKIICKIYYFLFIPYWVAKKKVVFSCGSCGKLYSVSKDSIYRDKAQELYKQTRYPLYCYIGLFIPLVLIITSFVLTPLSKKMFSDIDNGVVVVDNILNNIRPGAVIFYLSDNGEKTSMVVDKLSNDTLFVRKNNFTTSNNVYELDVKENYSPDLSVYTRSQIKQMNDKRIILNIY